MTAPVLTGDGPPAVTASVVPASVTTVAKGVEWAGSALLAAACAVTCSVVAVAGAVQRTVTVCTAPGATVPRLRVSLASTGVPTGTLDTNAPDEGRSMVSTTSAAVVAPVLVTENA